MKPDVSDADTAGPNKRSATVLWSWKLNEAGADVNLAESAPSENPYCRRVVRRGGGNKSHTRQDVPLTRVGPSSPTVKLNG